MESVLTGRAEQIIDLFEEDFLTDFLEDNPIIQDIVFFGSFMKGTNHSKSDLDIILVPTTAYLEETKEDEMDRIQTVIGFQEDLCDGLKQPLPLDVKLQEFSNTEEQFGWTFRTGNVMATFYSFIKGEIGQIALLSKERKLTFQQI